MPGKHTKGSRRTYNSKRLSIRTTLCRKRANWQALKESRNKSNSRPQAARSESKPHNQSARRKTSTREPAHTFRCRSKRREHWLKQTAIIIIHLTRNTSASLRPSRRLPARLFIGAIVRDWIWKASRCKLVRFKEVAVRVLIKIWLTFLVKSWLSWKIRPMLCWCRTLRRSRSLKA